MFLKKSMEQNIGIPRGVGVQTKNLLWDGGEGGYGYSGTANC